MLLNCKGALHKDWPTLRRRMLQSEIKVVVCVEDLHLLRLDCILLSEELVESSDLHKCTQCILISHSKRLLRKNKKKFPGRLDCILLS